MGLFDKVKGLVKGAANAVQPPPQQQQAVPQAPPQNFPQHSAEHHVEPDAAQADDSDDGSTSPGSIRDDDEGAFFRAVLHMESEGQFGGTDESRAEIMQQYGIRDRSHWQTVKDSNYAVLARKYGSFNEVSPARDELAPGRDAEAHDGADREDGGRRRLRARRGRRRSRQWAAINAAIVGGGNDEDLLKGAGIDKARWQRVERRVERADGARHHVRDHDRLRQRVPGRVEGQVRRLRARSRRRTRREPRRHDGAADDVRAVLRASCTSRRTPRSRARIRSPRSSRSASRSSTGPISRVHGLHLRARRRSQLDEVRRDPQARRGEFAAKYPGVKADVDIHVLTVGGTTTLGRVPRADRATPRAGARGVRAVRHRVLPPTTSRRCRIT